MTKKITDKKETITSNKPQSTSYRYLLSDIGSILKQGLTRAYKAVDDLKVQTYWQIGERIV
ncbi:MAG: hypothetical protein GQ477_03875 [Nanohaloarchaea archaeon]|nr:hypothetical protein [Candidatus Nanohaloarchaea archaeon]